jgi:SAM-dependent methyltransferase
VSNEFRGLAAHSADQLTEAREHWWNEDFLAMVAERWGRKRIGTVLDVGCGVGHWGRALASTLAPTTEFVGVDREPLWVKKATERVRTSDLGTRARYVEGRAEALPFPDGSFDLVTCQTLLIHVNDPDQVLAEMTRVARAGGVVAVAEPSNIASTLVDSIALVDSVENTAALLRLHLTCIRGKAALGLGDDTLGESVPRRLLQAGLQGVEVRNNDRSWPLVPPYSSPFELAQIEVMQDAVDRGLGLWDEETTRRYYRAGGGSERELDAAWRLALARRARVLEAVRAGTYTRAGGHLFYLAWGRKPADAGA